MKRSTHGRPRKLDPTKEAEALSQYRAYRHYNPKNIAHRAGITPTTLGAYITRWRSQGLVA